MALTHYPLFAKLPTDRAERWKRVKEFIALWHAPLVGNDLTEEIAEAEARLGFKLPPAIVEWYQIAEQGIVWSGQDYMLRLSELRFSAVDDALFIRTENQGCESWGIRRVDLDLADPPVWSFVEPREESPTVTAFAIVTLLLESIWKRCLMTNGGIETEEMFDYLATLSHCELPAHYWALDPVHFYETDSLYVVHTESDGFMYFVGVNTVAFQSIPPIVRSQLECINTEDR